MYGTVQGTMSKQYLGSIIPWPLKKVALKTLHQRECDTAMVRKKVVNKGGLVLSYSGNEKIMIACLSIYSTLHSQYGSY